MHSMLLLRFSALAEANASLSSLTRDQWRLLALRYQRITTLYEQCDIKGGAAAGGSSALTGGNARSIN